MAPRAAARGFAQAALGPARIAVGRNGIVIRVVPVAAPLMHIVADVVKAEGIGDVMSHGLGAVLPALSVVRERLRRVFSPGKLLLLDAAPGGSLPLGLGRKAVAAGGLCAQPAAIQRGFVPGNSDNWLRGMAEVWVLPEGWSRTRSRAEEPIVFGVGHLRSSEKKSINPDSVDRTLAILTGVRAHEKPVFRNVNKARFDGNWGDELGQRNHQAAVRARVAAWPLYR